MTKGPKKAAPKAPAKAPKADDQSGTSTDAAHLHDGFSKLADHNYLTEEQFATVSETLQRNLATTISLYLKLKKFHWDIRGRFFRDLHLAYDDFIDKIFPGIDEQAERLVMLGGSPIASPAEIARYSAVEVPSETIRDAREQVSQLVADLTRVARGYRDDSQTVDEAGDPATADMYNGILHTVDEVRWMLQAILDDDRLN